MKEKEYTQKRKNLLLVLFGIFLSNALVAEIIGVKIFSLEKTLGTSPAQITLLDGLVLDFNLTAGVVLWPVVFITSDIINEYFGVRGVKRISYLAATFIAYTFVIILLVTGLPPADFWIEVNKGGNNFNIDTAYAKIFRQGLGIIIGSISAFLIGQLLDAYVFRYMRKFTGKKKIWLRATGSTIVSQFVDSFVVLGIAFYWLGNWSLEQFISVGIINYIYKFAVAVFLTPLLYIIHYIVDWYLGEKVSKKMTEEAMKVH